MIQNLVPTTEYNLQRIGANLNFIIPLVSNINVSSAREASLVVRMMAASFAGTGTLPTLQFALVSAAPNGDGKIYQGTTALVTSSFGQAAPTAPKLVVGSVTGGLGGLVTLVMDYTQYQTTCTSAIFTVSIDLVQKA